VTAVVPQATAPTSPKIFLSRRWRRRNLTFDRISFFVVFLIIPVVGYIAFVVSPFAQAAYFSLTNWSGFTPDMKFIGLSNYTKLLHDATF
jgi:N-acetylglucosamine transport system permease protein